MAPSARSMTCRSTPAPGGSPFSSSRVPRRLRWPPDSRPPRLARALAPATPLSMSEAIAEFERMLHLGRGRAVLMLQRGEVEPPRELILHACLHNLAFDPQCE